MLQSGIGRKPIDPEACANPDRPYWIKSIGRVRVGVKHFSALPGGPRVRTVSFSIH